jgi:hypothetical protein
VLKRAGICGAGTPEVTLRAVNVMHRNALSRILATTLLAIADLAAAHHSRSMFVETPVWVTGTIVRYRPVDPRVMIELQEPQPGGAGRKWIVD